MTLRLPPLRERGGDILLLAQHYPGRACAEYGVRSGHLSRCRSGADRVSWPGNVRELANLMERVVVLSDGDQVSSAMLGLPREPLVRAPLREAGSSVDQQMASLERSRIEEALHAAGGNISQAAAQLGLPRNTLRYRLERHGLTDNAGGKRKRAADAGAEPRPEIVTGDRAAADPGTVAAHAHRAVDGHVPDSEGVVAEHERHRALEQAAAKAVAFGGRAIDLHYAGLVAAFGLQPAEDTPRHAAHAALAMLHQARAGRVMTTPAPPLRIVLHADEMLVGRLGNRGELDADARRTAEQVLAELRAHAANDMVLVSAATRPLLDSRFCARACRCGFGRAHARGALPVC